MFNVYLLVMGRLLTRVWYPTQRSALCPEPSHVLCTVIDKAWLVTPISHLLAFIACSLLDQCFAVANLYVS